MKEATHPVGIDKLGVNCSLCGLVDKAGEPDTQELRCSGCGAQFRSMQLAAMILNETGGVDPTLHRMLASGRLAGRSILDFTGDAALKGVLHRHSGYREAVLMLEPAESKPEGHHASLALSQLAENEIDYVLFRDVLLAHPEVRRFLREAWRICRFGGSVLLQDRFHWPLPDGMRGADLLAEMRRIGFLVYVDRVGIPIDRYYRGMAIVAQKD